MKETVYLMMIVGMALSSPYAIICKVPSKTYAIHDIAVWTRVLVRIVHSCMWFSSENCTFLYAVLYQWELYILVCSFIPVRIIHFCMWFYTSENCTFLMQFYTSENYTLLYAILYWSVRIVHSCVWFSSENYTFLYAVLYQWELYIIICGFILVSENYTFLYAVLYWSVRITFLYVVLYQWELYIPVCGFIPVRIIHSCMRLYTSIKKIRLFIWYAIKGNHIKTITIPTDLSC